MCPCLVVHGQSTAVTYFVVRVFSGQFLVLLAESREPLLLAAFVKRRNLAWLGLVTRPDGLSKTILQGTLEGGRRHGRQRKMPL